MTIISQNKIMRVALGITIMVIFLMAACMHLLFSPHHQNYATTCHLADFRTQPYHNGSFVNVYKKESICAFPVDFELPELKFSSINQIILPLVIFLGQFEFLAKNHFFSLSRSARAPPI